MEGILSTLYKLACDLAEQLENPEHSPSMHTLIRSMGIQADVMAELISEQLDEEGLPNRISYPDFESIRCSGLYQELRALA